MYEDIPKRHLSSEESTTYLPLDVGGYTCI